MEKLNDAEKEFIQSLSEALPPIIARKEIGHFLGGLVSSKTLSNADSAGRGPKIAYKVGATVVYRTDELLMWIVLRFGIKRLVNVDHLGGVNL